MKRAGKVVSCPSLFIHLLFNKRATPLVENSSKHNNFNNFIDGKHCMDNFNTTKLHRFSWFGQLCMYMHKKITAKY